jgi:hypothetical protein
MTAWMCHGDNNTVGSLTSGGTESILMAVKTYRDLAKAKRPYIHTPKVCSLWCARVRVLCIHSCRCLYVCMYVCMYVC